MLEKITNKARSIKDFDRLSITAQLALLMPEIQAAREFGISNGLIRKAINDGGGQIKSDAYFRQALHNVRKKHPGGPPKPPETRTIQPAKSSTPSPVTTKQARENKAKEYATAASTNPLFSKTQKKE